MTFKRKTPAPIRAARRLFIVFSFLATAAFAQNVLQLGALNANGAAQANSQSAQITTLTQSAAQRVPPRVIALPALPSPSAAALSAPAPGRPLQIGVARAVSATANAALTAGLLSWTQAADGSQRAAISVQAPGAQGLRLGLLVTQLPSGALLRVYAPNSAETIQITAAQVLSTLQANLNAGDSGNDAHTYWLPTVQGDQAVLEIQLPAGVSPAQLQVSLPQVSQLTLSSAGNQAIAMVSGSCNIDVM